ncbi:MAG: GHKL domain-containing protein [Lachnospiraceae bacterium]|nr:GHKL domain-containing protein [Lachnospiraceae bacterium]
MRPPTVDLYNTPGIYYAAAYWIGSMVFGTVLSKERRSASTWIKQLLLLAVLCIFMTLTNHKPAALFIPCLLVDFALTCANLRFSCVLTPEETIYYSARAFMVGELAAALDWQVFYYALTTLKMPLNMRTNLTFLLPTWLLVFGVSYLTERFIFKRHGRPEISRSIVAAIMGVIAVFYFWSNISYIVRGTAFTASGAQELFIIRTLSDLGAVVFSEAYHMMVCQLSARLESEKLNQVLEMQYAAYKVSEESIALVNRKYHDLKHQISVLRDSTSEIERHEYLDQMEEDIRSFEAQTHTGNEVLDAILGTKMLQCMQEGIDLHVMAEGEALGFMDKMDISALFGNILDNAIEGTRKVDEPEDRRIRLYVNAQKGFLKILAENTFRGKVSFEEGIPMTSKTHEVGYHGYGVRSIRATAEKYDGNVIMKAEDGWFRVHVLIPQQ